MTFLFAAATLIVGVIISGGTTAQVSNPPIVLAQAMVPPTGMDDASRPMPSG
jgi:hypothetical protein